MNSNLEILILSGFVLGYCITLGYAHILLARIDRKVKIYRPGSGQISVRNVKALIVGGEDNPGIRKAITMLKINSAIVILFFAWLTFDYLFKLLLSNNLHLLFIK